MERNGSSGAADGREEHDDARPGPVDHASGELPQPRLLPQRVCHLLRRFPRPVAPQQAEPSPRADADQARRGGDGVLLAELTLAVGQREEGRVERRLGVHVSVRRLRRRLAEFLAVSCRDLFPVPLLLFGKHAGIKYFKEQIIHKTLSSAADFVQ